MAENNLEVVKQELNQQAQIMKDRFIDEILKKTNEFSQDWNRIMGKKAELDAKEKADDKLNK